MTQKVNGPDANRSLSQKIRAIIHWLLHRNGPLRNWRYIPTRLLLRKLRSESYEIRAYAAEGLGSIGDVHAIAPLIGALSDENTTVRRFAISSLGHLRDERAVDVLIPFIHDEEPDMRCAAVVALGELGLTPTPPRQVIEALIASMADTDRAVCSAAVVALGRIGNPQAISALNALAETTESEWIRRYISEALHQIEEQNA